MSLRKKAMNTTAYAKIGIMGFQGSGKTYTAAEMALGIVERLGGKAKRSVSFYDTETGSDFLIPKFEKAGVELFVHKGRAFTDLLQFIRESEKAGDDVLIIDSVSHVWKELMESYQRKLRRKNGLYFQDWSAVKTEWGQFTDLYLNSKVHILMLGRAGYEYEHEKNEDTGRLELIKSGTKMKVEGEMGYEPSLLLEMERHRVTDKKGWTHRCTVLKDRSDTINGQQFDNPTFKCFAPFFDFLNLGGNHVGLDTSRTSEDLFESPDRSFKQLQIRRQVALEKIQEALLLAGKSGTAEKVKKERAELLINHFGTSSKTEMEERHPDQLEKGLDSLRISLGLVKEELPSLEAVGDFPC